MPVKEERFRFSETASCIIAEEITRCCFTEIINDKLAL